MGVTAAASLIALAAAGASTLSPQPTFSSVNYTPSQELNILYSQNSNYAGGAINSQNFTDGSFSTYSDQAADDFVVPSGQVWKVTEVDVSGQYYNDTTQASSENVIFYKNKHGMPGSPVTNGTFMNLNGMGTAGNFAIKLSGTGVQLKSGRYWVSVTINMGFYEQGDLWAWDANTKRHGEQAMWRNPGGAFGYCQTWDTAETCVGSPGPDLMFALKGKIK